MSTELVKKSNWDLSVAEINNLSELFFKSGFFPDIKSAAQAGIKILAGKEIGMPPFASLSNIHIINGKPTIGAGMIASAVKGSGKYDYRVVHQDEKACSIDFYQSKEKIGNSTFTIEDAKKAGTKNLDKFPKNMLFARAISNGVKWFCPDVFSGPVYTPEEMESVQETQDVQAEITTANRSTSMVHIAQPSPDQPEMTEEERQYRIATNDVEVIYELIDAATDPKLLKVFYSVNNAFFKTNPEAAERLREKGKSLNPQKAA